MHAESRYTLCHITQCTARIINYSQRLDYPLKVHVRVHDNKHGHGIISKTKLSMMQCLESSIVDNLSPHLPPSLFSLYLYFPSFSPLPPPSLSYSLSLSSTPSHTHLQITCSLTISHRE